MHCGRLDIMQVLCVHAQVSRIPKWQPKNAGITPDTRTAINTEWGCYGSNFLPRVKEDFELDAASGPQQGALSCEARRSRAPMTCRCMLALLRSHIWVLQFLLHLLVRVVACHLHLMHSTFCQTGIIFANLVLLQICLCTLPQAAC